ncbi:MAG: MBL fold metallo-hydrolase [Thermoleophilia bacterium]|nr:MBL fold metallo-hydrolase [Thermoleophilia bacterium]
MKILCVPVGPLQANCYLVWDDERRACAVDPGGEPERLAGIVREEGLALEAILVTHGHFDHVEGVKGLADATGASVYCSAEVAPVLKGTKDCSATGLAIPAVDGGRLEIVSDGSELSVGALRVTVIATPGHTPGDITFDIGGHLFPGDLVFYRSVGRTDFPGGDFAELLNSVRKLAQRYPTETPVHPGHMQSTTLHEELAMNPFLGGLSVHG